MRDVEMRALMSTCKKPAQLRYMRLGWYMALLFSQTGDQATDMKWLSRKMHILGILILTHTGLTM